MYILILGCDMLGAQLAADLAEEGHRITVMDARPDCFDGLHYGPNVDAVLTSESLIDDLRSVGINNVDAFFCRFSGRYQKRDGSPSSKSHIPRI
jgi:Trk K+ transport system NAD-binding subunit